MADQEDEERDVDLDYSAEPDDEAQEPVEEEDTDEGEEEEEEEEEDTDEDTDEGEEEDTDEDEEDTDEEDTDEGEEEVAPEENASEEGVSPPVTPPVAEPAEQPPPPDRGFVRQNAVRPEEEGEAPSPIQFDNIEEEPPAEEAAEEVVAPPAEEVIEPPAEEVVAPPAEEAAEEGVEGENPPGVEGAQPLAYEYDLPDDFNYATYKLPVGIEVEEETYARTNYGSQDNAVQRDKSSELILANKDTIYVGLNLFEEDLTNLNLDNKVFISCIFAGANITKTSMRKCVLYNCNLTRADMTDINLFGSFIYNCNMSDAMCNNGNFSNIYCKYPDVDDFEEDPDWFDERPFLQEVVINRQGTPGQLPEIEDRDEKFVQMNRARLVRASFNNAVLDNVSFMDAKMQYATLLSASCRNTSFEYATLHEANFTNAICIVTVFTGVKAKQICFNNATLNYANCREADFRHGDFRRSALLRTVFDYSRLDKAIIQNCDATGVILTGTIMRECIIKDTVFFTEEALVSNFSGVNLVGSILINCNLKQALLIRAKCCDVQFIGCNLNETQVINASLIRTSFTRCDLVGINLNGTFLDNEMYTNFYSTGIITDDWEPPEERERPYIAAACDRRPPIEPPNFENTGAEELDPLFILQEEGPTEGAPREGVEGENPPAGENDYNVGDQVYYFDDDVLDYHHCTISAIPPIDSLILVGDDLLAGDVNPVAFRPELFSLYIENDEIYLNMSGVPGEERFDPRYSVRMYFIDCPTLEDYDEDEPFPMLVKGQDDLVRVLPPGETAVGDEEEEEEEERVERENPPFDNLMLPHPDYYTWDPALEAVPRAPVVEEEEEEVITDAAGNRTRVPQERDIEVIRRIYSQAFQQQLGQSTPFNVIMLSDLWSDPMPTSLRYMNFKEVDLRNINFSDMDLTGCNFFGCQLNDTSFVNANLTQVNLQWADLINIDFTGATFEGDYSAGGLLEGATIRNCNFIDTILADRFDLDTVISPYSPRAYPHDLALPAGVPETININGNGILMEEAAEGEEEEAQAQQMVQMSPILYENPGNYIVLRIIESNRTFKDYIVERDVINENLNNNTRATVYPCLKPFNMPGPSYPVADQRSFHDITRPVFNIGSIIPRRVFVMKDIFRNILLPLEANEMLVFFTDGDSETVPTFVSQSVLGGANWVSELHCNSGAERETIWYVKTIGISEEELPVAAAPVASPVRSPRVSPNASPIGVEGAEPLEEEPLEPGSPPAFTGDYVDPFGSDSESSTASAPPTPEPVIPYNPIFIVRYIPIAAPLNTSTAMGNIVRQGMVLPSLVPIAAQLSPQIPTTTLVLRVVNGANTKNYLIKYNELVEMFKNYNEDYYPCKVAEPVSVDRDDIDEERCLINIGKIIKQQIFVDKAEFITMFLDKKTVRKERSYIVQFDDASERVPAVIKVKAGTPALVKRVVIWNIQVWPNDLPKEVVAPASEEAEGESEYEEGSEEATETGSEATSTESEEPPSQAPFVLPPNPVIIDDDAPPPILPENDPYKVGNSVMFDQQNRQPPNLNSYNIIAAGSNQSDRVLLHLREPVEGLFDPTEVGADYNKFYYYRVLREGGFLRNSAGQYFKNGERYIIVSRAGAGTPCLVNVKDVVLPESMAGGSDRIYLRGHNTTIRKHHHRHMNDTLRRHHMRIKKSRHLQRKFKKAFTKRIGH